MLWRYLTAPPFTNTVLVTRFSFQHFIGPSKRPWFWFGHNLLLHKRDPRPVLPAHTVPEATKTVTVDVVLKIARVETIRQVEYLQSEFDPVALELTNQT